MAIGVVGHLDIAVAEPRLQLFHITMLADPGRGGKVGIKIRLGMQLLPENQWPWLGSDADGSNQKKGDPGPKSR